MTGLHCPWPLFGDDLELARSWLRPQLRGVVSLRTGHMAISLGMGNALIDGLQGGEFQAEAKALREWRFRLARLDGEANPYRHLLPEGLLEHTRATITHCRTTGKALNVRLNGGIGDHLEVLSQLLHWAKEKQCFLNMMMSIERQQQIESLLPHWQEIGCNLTRKQSSAPIPMMAIRAAISVEPKPTPYRQWLTTTETLHPMERRLLFCWRAAGVGDRLSSHSRSVPWALVHDFYRRIQHLQPKSHIVDITNWQNWEARQLRTIGVETIDPRQGTLFDLAQRCRISRVVSIDTALVHLCAAAGQRADLLLSAFPDERWQELHQPEHHYGKLIKIWRSFQFGSWEPVLDSLVNSFSVEA